MTFDDVQITNAVLIFLVAFGGSWLGVRAELALHRAQIEANNQLAKAAMKKSEATGHRLDHHVDNHHS